MSAIDIELQRVFKESHAGRSRVAGPFRSRPNILKFLNFLNHLFLINVFHP